MSNHEYNVKLAHLLNRYRNIGIDALGLVNNSENPPDHFILWFKPLKNVTRELAGCYKDHLAALDNVTQG